MADSKDLTDEELELRVNRVRGRTGVMGKLADIVSPAPRKLATEAEIEIKKRSDTRKKPDEPATPVKEIIFKKGGHVRGDGCAVRGKTKGRFV